MAGWLAPSRGEAVPDEAVVTSMVTAVGSCESGKVRTVRDAGVTVAGCTCTSVHAQQIPAGLVAVVAAGVVSNRAELRSEVRTQGTSIRDGSDAKLLLAEFLAWDAGVAERIAGACAVVIWDGRDGRLLLVRDRLGIAPLFYAHTDNGDVVVASTEAGALAHPAVEPVVGLDGLRDLFGYDRTPGRGLWQQVREVPPGGVVTIDPAGGLHTRRYWSLRPDPHEAGHDAAVARVRDLLTTSAMSATDGAATGTDGVLVGGLDSAILAALAGEQAPPRSTEGAARLVTVTLEDGSIDGDGAFGHAVADATGATYHGVRLTPDQLADPEVRLRALRARAAPMGVGDMDFSLLLLLDQARQHGTVWLSGEGADGVFAAGRMYTDPTVRQEATFPWLPHLDGITAERELFTPEFAAALDLEAYVAESYQAAVAGIEPVGGETEEEAYARRIHHLQVTRFMRQLIDRADRMARAAGVRVRMPYLDHRLVEYLYNTPWSVKRPEGGASKPLLRAAFGRLVPASVLERRKVPYPVTATSAYTALIQQQAGEVVTNAGHSVWDLLRRDRVRELVATPSERVSMRDRRGLERVLDTTLWLDTYHPTVRFCAG